MRRFFENTEGEMLSASLVSVGNNRYQNSAARPPSVANSELCLLKKSPRSQRLLRFLCVKIPAISAYRFGLPILKDFDFLIFNFDFLPHLVLCVLSSTFADNFMRYEEYSVYQ